MKVMRKIIHIDDELCDGCGQCVPSCAEGALQIVDGKAQMIAEKFCDGLGACLGECPTGALMIEERDADDFDEKAVEEHLKSQEAKEPETPETMACGCPSTLIQAFEPKPSCQAANQPTSREGVEESALGHWPVQIKLVPPTAPFLKGADLLVAADCTPLAYPHFHRDFLKGKVIMLGCPKFDNSSEYVEKFAQIFTTADIKSVAVVDMEVPCCSALPQIVKQGIADAGKKIPIEEIVISTRGEILKRELMAA